MIFSAGVLVGSFCTGYGISYFFERFKGDQEYRIDFLMRRLSRELDLSELQKKKIRIILVEADQEFDQFWTKVLGQADIKLDNIKEEIIEQLDAAQVVQFEKFSEKVKARRARNHSYFVPSIPAEKSSSK